MKATCFPSADQLGLTSKSTLGATYVTARVFTSYTAMNPWSVRVVTKAIFDPSGDQRGLDCTPHSLMNGLSPLSMSVALSAGVTAAR